MGIDEEKATVDEVYPNIRKISVDYAIMELSSSKGDVLVIPGEFDFSWWTR